MSVFVSITRTSLNNSECNATKEVQEFLKQGDIHDFSLQQPGDVIKIEAIAMPSKNIVPLTMKIPPNRGREKRLGILKVLINELGLQAGDSMELAMDNGTLVVRKVTTPQDGLGSSGTGAEEGHSLNVRKSADELEVGSRYTRDDIHSHYYGEPVPDVGTGNWTSGYTRVEEELVVFMNIGVPGRTGHDFDNHYDESTGTITWYGKPGSHSGQPTFQKLLNGELIPYFFARWDSSDPQFRFLGAGRILDHEDDQPTVFSSGEQTTTIKLTLQCLGQQSVSSQLEETQSAFPKTNEENQASDSMLSYPDRFLAWQSSKPGAVRRPFTARDSRPLGPDGVLKTGLVHKLEELVENLCTKQKPEGWIKPKGIFLVGGAGNGKSDGLEEFLNCLARKCQNSAAAISRLESIFSEKKRKLVIDLTDDLQGLDIGFDQIEVVQDATEGDGSENTSGDLLLKELDSLGDGETLLICNINRGILEGARMASAKHGSSSSILDFLDECTSVIDPLAYGKECWPSRSGFYIWPLDLESLVGECEVPVFTQLLEHCIDSKNSWSEELISLGNESSIACNRSNLADPSCKANLCRLLNDFELLSGERWTFRDLFSLLSYLLTGGFRRGESQLPSEVAISLSLPPESASPLKRVNDTLDALRTTIPQLLFPNWPAFAQVKKANEKMGSNNVLFGHLMAYLQKVPLPEPRLPVERILRNEWSEMLDPALGMDFEISLEGKNLTEAELEDSFAVSVSRGFSRIEELDTGLLGNIEKAFLKLLIDIEEEEIKKSLMQDSGPAEQSTARSLQAWLRKFGLVVVKRFIGFKFGHGHESNSIRFFQDNICNYRLLMEICEDFEKLLGDGDVSSLKVELNLGLCQPRGLFRDRGIMLEASPPRVRHELLEAIPQRPSPDSAKFLFDCRDGKKPIVIPFTFQLFKRLAAHRENLVPACLDPMIRGFMDRYRMLLDGKAVRSWSGLERERITIKFAGERDLFRGYLENFENQTQVDE